MTATTTTTTEIECDAPYCRASISVSGTAEGGSLEACRLLARQVRWHHTGARDWCPWHTDPEKRLASPRNDLIRPSSPEPSPSYPPDPPEPVRGHTAPLEPGRTYRSGETVTVQFPETVIHPLEP